jgi:competence transcription factor ComK
MINSVKYFLPQIKERKFTENKVKFSFAEKYFLLIKYFNFSNNKQSNTRKFRKKFTKEAYVHRKKMKNANDLARTNVGIPLLESRTILLL